MLSASFAFSQYDERKFNLSGNVSYTTTAKIYLSPNSSSPSLRNNFFQLEHILSGGLDLRYRFTERILFGFSSEYMEAEGEGKHVTIVLLPQSTTETINVKDGFVFIPIELSLYYLMPFSTDRFKFIMGGGAGLYYGDHKRSFGTAEIENAGRNIAYGIHVALGMDYILRKSFTLRVEMKFRDPQFTVTSRYVNQEITYNGQKAFLPVENFTTKINIDGITFSGGVVFHF